MQRALGEVILLFLSSNARIVTKFVEANPRQFRSETLRTEISGS